MELQVSVQPKVRRRIRSKMEKQYTPAHMPEKKVKAAASKPAVSQLLPQKAAEVKSVPVTKNEDASKSAATPQPEASEKDKKTEVKSQKEEAIAQGTSLSLSKKHCMYICSFIKNKSIDSALSDLEQVLLYKKAVPFKGEIPHRKGMMSGRYPITAAKEFITLLKGLKGNIIVNGLLLERTRIYYASASWASRQMKRGGARFKRTHVLLKAKEVDSEDKTQIKTKNENKENKEEKK